MPFDTFTMAAISDELRDATVGGQIQRIIQPSAPSVALSIYAGGSLKWVVLSADARLARVHLASERLAKGFATPSSFIMLLRKYLEGSRLLAIEQQSYERVLRLVCGGADHRVALVAEVMGKHSNVILVDADETVLGAVKIVPPRQSRVRPIMPGRRYTPPPARERDADLFGSGERVDPFTGPYQFLQLLERAPARSPLSKALLGLLPGAGPFLVEEVARRAGADPKDALLDAPLQRVSVSGAEIYSLYHSRDWEPTIFESDRGRRDFAPLVPTAARDVIRIPSMSLAVEEQMGAEESRDALSATRRVVLDRTERALAGARHRVSSLYEGLLASDEAESAMERGQLILAYQYRLAPRAERLEIPELETSIALDANLAPSENAEKAFRRYRKLRDARNRIPRLLESAETEVGRLEDLSTFVRLAQSESELRALERSLDREQPERKKTGKREKRRGPARFHRNGDALIVGRNALENEEVTFRLARRDDLWFHARQRTGAHVVLHSAGAPGDEALEAAAAVAAYFSEGRNDTAVDVDVARVRDVRKIPGGPPGRVTYRGENTLRVAPGMKDWVSDSP